METRAALYLHLFHGRNTPDESLDNWGFDGPVLRIHGFHVTYLSTYRIGLDTTEDNEYWADLDFVGDLLHYGGKYYGDWSIFSPGTDPHLEARAVPVDTDLLTAPEEPEEPALKPEPTPADTPTPEALDTGDPASYDSLEQEVRDLADIIEAYQVHSDVNFDYWVQHARKLIGDL